MAVIRANLISGQVQENPLSSVALQLTMSGKLTNLPTVAGGDRAYLTIDPQGVDTLSGSGPEIVAVSAYTHGAGTASILRGQRGTTARPHSQGVKVILGWDKEDADLKQDVNFTGTQSGPAQGDVGAVGTSLQLPRADHGHRLVLDVAVNSVDFHTGSAIGLKPGHAVVMTPAYTSADDRVSVTVAVDDGAGSGLDADTLDGKQGSAYFLVASHTKAVHDALNIDADTLDGHDSAYFAAAAATVHYVSDVGEPAFQNHWQGLGGSWGNARFWKDGSGVVHLAGSIQLGAGWPANTVAFTLPTGFRPPVGADAEFGAVVGGIFSRIDVDGSTGDVVVGTINSPPDGSYASLDGINFPTFA